MTVYYDLRDGELVALDSEEAAQILGVADRRLIPKSTITARLIEAGKMGAAMTALMSDPASFGRWFTPDWPNVYADDDGLIAFLTAIGADVAAITAP